MFAANKTQHCRYISASHEPIEARCMCQSPLCRALDFLKHTFIKCSRVVCSCCPRLLFKGCRGRERGREKETKPYRMNHGVCQQFNLPACRSLLHHVLIVRDRAVYITCSHFGMAASASSAIGLRPMKKLFSTMALQNVHVPHAGCWLRWQSFTIIS